MPCSISGLKLDKDSQAALKRINKKKNFAKLLGVAISAGVFSNIFTKSNAPVTMLNITQTDWSLYSQAMSSLPKTTKVILENEIDLMILHYQLGTYNHKHIQFWKGMKNGCR